MANLNYISPCFIVDHIPASVAFYTEKLGFELRYLGPDGDPYFAIVGRENVAIMLKGVAPDIKPIPNHTRHEWAPSDAYISVADPKTLFDEFNACGVLFRRPLGINSDNLLSFEVEDADGYVLFFGRPE